MEFEAEYIIGMSKVLGLTLLISIIPIYFFDIENQFILLIISFIIFFVILSLKNKQWIKSVKIDSKKAELRIEYPMSLIGNKKITFSFSDIKKATYYEYMYRTPAHYKIEFNSQKLRFSCNENESKKINLILEKEGIKTFFYHKKENVGFR